MKKYEDPFLCDFIRNNLNKIPLKDIALKTKVSKSTVAKIIKRYGMKIDTHASVRFRIAGRTKNPTSLSPEHDQYIQENYLTIPVKTLARHIGRVEIVVRTRLKQLGLVIPPEIIQKRKDDSRIKAGNIPKYKGKKLADHLAPEQLKSLEKFRFQKGHIPVNALYDGAEVIKKDSNGNTYKYVRISAKNWRVAHVINYEKKYGKIPKGYCLRCKTQDSTNDDPDNWELISRKENMIKNSGSKDLTDAYVLGNLAPKNPELKAIIREEYPELIELKKNQLILNRKIKTYEQKQNPRKN
jgi:hypothetical protein